MNDVSIKIHSGGSFMVGAIACAIMGWWIGVIIFLIVGSIVAVLE